MSQGAHHLYEFGPFRLDTAEQRLSRDGTPVPLTPIAFELLLALVERNGHLVGKDELIQAVWPDRIVEESNLTNNIYELRKILGQTEDGRGHIETVPKRGYRFAAQVRESSADTPETQERTIPPVVAEEHEVVRVESGTKERRLKFSALSAAILVGAAAVYGSFAFLARASNDEKTVSGMPFEEMDIARVTTSGNVTHAAVSSDGKYVASVVKDASGNSIWVKHVDSPSNVRVAGPAITEFVSVTFAPDDKNVYYVALDHDKGEPTLVRIPALGGVADTVATNVFPIGFSPDGRQFAFIRMRREESTLVLADADGSNQRVLATLRKPDLFELEWNAPAWSPDGKTVAAPVRLNDQRGGYGTVLGVGVEDGATAALTTQRWSYVAQPVFLPDGTGLLVSASEQSGSPLQVWHVRIRDGLATRVTQDLNNYRDLSLTRDASRLVAVQANAVSSIFVSPPGEMNSASQVRSETGSLSAVAWTPDGRLVFSSRAGGNGADIWVANADGSDAKQLTVGARIGQGVTVTPDGRYIVFSSEATDRFHLWRVDSDGGNLRQLTNGTGEFFPHVTPDGRWIVYQSELTIDPRLWKVPIDGGTPVQVTATRGAKPAVSPDGKAVAYTYLDIELNPMRWGIGVTSTDGRGQLNRFDFPPTVIHRYVRWSPDGKSIAFVNTTDGSSDIWLQPLDGRPPHRLTTFKAEQIVAFDWSRDARSLAVVRRVETSDAVRIQSR
jgi:Tol biopolymer transport system component/DNA-binding winged helix-turn-helix (wHTH) protein